MKSICPSAATGGVRAHVLQEPNMRWYLGTQLFSLTGMMLRSSVLSLFIIEAVGIRNAPTLVGTVWALNVLPGAFLGVFAGMFVDRYDKRDILRITAVLGIIQALALAFITSGNPREVAIWKIFAVMGFTGFTNMIDGIGRNAIIKDAILHHHNERLGSIMFNSLYTFAMVLGNGIAGYLVLSIGYSNSFILNGASFLVLIFGLSKLNFDHRNGTRSVHKPGWKGVMHSAAEGARYTFTEPGIRICILVAAAITVFGFAYNVLMSVIAKQMYFGGPKEYSYLAAIAGMGSLIGSIVAIAWSGRAPTKFVVAGCLIAGICQIVAAQTTSIHFGALAFFGSGFGFMLAFLPIRGAVMHIVDRRLVGIVLGITFMFFYGGMMVSSFASGYIAKHYGCPAVLTGCGLALIALSIATPFLPGIDEIE